ncbi:enoyl-CoA delta isomerase 2, peroxisomal-like [Argentina anserina]|uniref:enoyl-CoA delta isomerase 2, peroxisomal-like n=1 Tax=Argentina anserina TaxID=57926 RepID=UPI0021768AC9|nr:enoyl-CoA delta isomerase 2, peroxisomal-like [Potentilla anserina]
MCTLEKRGNIFFLTLTGAGDADDEHRLGLPVISSLLTALSDAASQSTRGSVLITTARGKFFSNGFDLAWAQSSGDASSALRQMVVAFKPVVAALLSLPMPTVAALPGHAAAAGFLLALSHDYVTMRGDRGVLYMSEVDLGLGLPDYFAAAFRAKIGSVSARRDILQRGMKVGGEEAVRMGIVDSAHESAEAAVEAAVRMAEKLGERKWKGDVYAEIRMSLYPELCAEVGLSKAVPKAKL